MLMWHFVYVNVVIRCQNASVLPADGRRLCRSNIFGFQSRQSIEGKLQLVMVKC